MKVNLGRPPLVFGGAALLSGAPVAAVLWILPLPHGPFEYLIAGTAAASLWLLAALVFLIRRGLLRRRGGGVRLWPERLP